MSEPRSPEGYARALLDPDPAVAAEAWRHILDNVSFETIHAERITADSIYLSGEDTRQSG